MHPDRNFERPHGGGPAESFDATGTRLFVSIHHNIAGFGVVLEIKELEVDKTGGSSSGLARLGASRDWLPSMPPGRLDP
jgi:hypothetical protein